MRLLKTCLISILFLMHYAPNAIAARTGLLLLGNLHQQLDVSYLFDGSQANNSSTTNHSATQGYNLGFDYAVLRPQILTGSIDFTVRYQENLSGSSGNAGGFTSGLGLLYNIDGTFFNRSTFPSRFFLNSSITDVPLNFGQSYTLKNDNYGVLWSLQNKYLPIAAHYSRSISTTSGLVNDNTNTHDEVGLSLSHVKGVSSTSLNLLSAQDDFVSTTEAGSTSSRNYEAKLANNLTWTDGAKYRNVNSSLRYSAAAGLNEFSNLDLSESLTWDLGKALKSGLFYSHGESETPRLTQKTNAVRLSLGHKLFESLTTQLQATARDLSQNTGSEQQISGRGNLGYTKILPRDSRVNLQVYKEYGITARNLSSGSLTIQDESHTVSFGVQIFLVKPGIVPGSIIVRNANPLLHPLPYISGTDYSVVQNGDQSEIVVSSNNVINDSDILLITYDYLVNSDIEYSTNSQGGSAEIAFFSNRYRVYGSIDQTRQTQLSGQTSLVALQSQDMYRFGISSILQGVTTSSEYNHFSSGTDNHQSLMGSVRYSGGVAEGILSIYARDLYLWYSQSEAAGTITNTPPQNNFGTGVNFRKGVLESAMLTLLADYQMTTGSLTSNALSVGVYFTWHVGKIALSLQTRAGFRQSGSTTFQDEHVRFNISRFF